MCRFKLTQLQTTTTYPSSIRTKSMANRDKTIDIGKGIAIILMCVGHSYVCTFLDTFIYLFHMAFFFMMSGYFFREKNLAAPRTFLWKRIKGLYFPFVKWGFIFVALHNVFTTLGINTREAGFYSIKDMAYKAFTTNTRFIPTEECMGPYWFFSCLFFVSLLSFTIFHVNKNSRHKAFTTTASFIGLYTLGFVLHYFNIFGGWMQIIIRTFVVTFIFYLGYLLGTRFKDKINYKNPFLILGSFVVLCIGVIGGGKISIPQLEFTNPVCFPLFSIAGSFLVLGISSYIHKYDTLSKTFAYIGEHSLSILLVNLLLRRIYLLMLFSIEYEGIDFNNLDLQQTLHWWDSIGCTVFMVVVPISVIKIKSMLTKTC